MRKGLTGETTLSETGRVSGSISTSLAAYSTQLVVTALEWSSLDGQTDVVPSRLKSAAELLVLRQDTLKLIDGAGPDALAPSQNKAEEPSANGKEPEQQTVPENERRNPSQTVETAKEQEHTSKTANCTFSGELVSIDLKRFTESSISLVECPHCGRMRSLSPVKAVLRFKPHTRRKQQTSLTEKRWSATGKTAWDVVGGEGCQAANARQTDQHMKGREHMSTSGNNNTDRNNNASFMPQPKVLLSGLAMPESARWHEGRVWFAHWGTGEIVAVDLNGTSEVITRHAPPAFGWSIDWLADGRLLVTGKELMRMEKDGSMVRHADLSSISQLGWNEIVVDGRGNIYVNSINFGFLAGEQPQAGIIALVTPDGKARKVADGLSFPNGMVVSPDNATLIVSESFAGRLTAFDITADGSLSNQRVWAEGRLGPDGICMDAEGAIWVQGADIRAVTHRDDSPEGVVFRMREGGEVLQRIEYDKDIFSVTLGGPDGKTLFMLATEFRGAAKVKEVAESRVGEVVISQAPAPGAGWP